MASLLFVDDDATLLGVLLELFSREHECGGAATAEAAFDLLRSREFDLVVTDITMPGMSGEALLGFIKVHSPGTPVVFISGAKEAEIAQRLKVKGAAGFLAKPFDIFEIRESVTQILERRCQ
jgi:DNA-binding NtrC family response regulator